MFGSRYVAVLRDVGGVKRVDHAFGSPPRTEEDIIDPVAARSNRSAVRVKTPKLTDDERRNGKADDFGVLSLYLVLASRIDPQLALRAAEGWGGDRYVGFTRRGTDGQECVRVVFAGDTSADTAEIADVLTTWTSALPAGAATSERVGDRVELTACDAGTTPAPSAETLDAAVTLLVDRNDLALELLHAQAPPRLARCAADHLAADPALLALLDVDEFSDAQEQQFTERIQEPCTCRSR